MVNNKREGIVTRKDVHRERLGAEPIWHHMVFKKMHQCVWRWRTIWVSWLLHLSSCFMSSSTCRMRSLLTQVASACCFQRLGLVLVSLPILQKPLSVSQDTAAETQKRSWIPSGFYLAQFPCVFSDLISPPQVLATPAKEVSRTRPPGLCAGGGRCVLAELGQVRQKCVWLAWCVTKKRESPALQDLGQRHLCWG